MQMTRPIIVLDFTLILHSILHSNFHKISMLVFTIPGCVPGPSFESHECVSDSVAIGTIFGDLVRVRQKTIGDPDFILF